MKVSLSASPGMLAVRFSVLPAGPSVPLVPSPLEAAIDALAIVEASGAWISVDHGHRATSQICKVRMTFKARGSTGIGPADSGGDSPSGPSSGNDGHGGRRHRQQGPSDSGNDPWSGWNDPWSAGHRESSPHASGGDSKRPRFCGAIWQVPAGADAAGGGGFAHHANIGELSEPELPTEYDVGFTSAVPHTFAEDVAVQTDAIVLPQLSADTQHQSSQTLITLKNTVVLPLAEPNLMLEVRCGDRGALRRLDRRAPQPPCVRHLQEDRTCGATPGPDLPAPQRSAFPPPLAKRRRPPVHDIFGAPGLLPPGRPVDHHVLVRDLVARRVQCAWRAGAATRRSDGDSDVDHWCFCGAQQICDTCDILACTMCTCCCGLQHLRLISVSLTPVGD